MNSKKSKTAKPEVAIIYVSPGVKKNSGKRSLEIQKLACETRAMLDGVHVEALCVDGDFERDVSKRPGLQEVLRYCGSYRGRVQYLYVYRRDRLGWNKAMRKIITNKLASIGVTVRDATGWLKVV